MFGPHIEPQIRRPQDMGKRFALEKADPAGSQSVSLLESLSNGRIGTGSVDSDSDSDSDCDPETETGVTFSVLGPHRSCQPRTPFFDSAHEYPSRKIEMAQMMTEKITAPEPMISAPFDIPKL